MKLALLVIDMQKAYLSKVDPAVVDSAVEHINYTADIVRSAGHLVIHVQDIEDADSLGMDELAFIEEIHVDEKDAHMTKTFSNAFWETGLKER